MLCEQFHQSPGGTYAHLVRKGRDTFWNVLTRYGASLGCPVANIDQVLHLFDHFPWRDKRVVVSFFAPALSFQVSFNVIPEELESQT